MLSIHSHTRTSPGDPSCVYSHGYDERSPRSADSDRVVQHVACRSEQPLLNQWRTRVCGTLHVARCKPPRHLRRVAPSCTVLSGHTLSERWASGQVTCRRRRYVVSTEGDYHFRRVQCSHQQLQSNQAVESRACSRAFGGELRNARWRRAGKRVGFGLLGHARTMSSSARSMERD